MPPDGISRTAGAATAVSVYLNGLEATAVERVGSLMNARTIHNMTPPSKKPVAALTRFAGVTPDVHS
jgi:hypothetical protein